MWATKKPLVIALIALFILLILGIIFLIVYFVVIKPGQEETPVEPTSNADAKINLSTKPEEAAHMAIQTMRHFRNLMSELY